MWSSEKNVKMLKVAQDCKTITLKETEMESSSPFQKEASGPESFIAMCYNTFKEEIIPTL